MHKPVLLIAATGLGLAALVQPASAQDMTTSDLQRDHDLGRRRGAIPVASRYQVHGVSTRRLRRQKNSESDWLDFGGAAGGGIETALGIWGNRA